MTQLLRIGVVGTKALTRPLKQRTRSRDRVLVYDDLCGDELGLLPDIRWPVRRESVGRLLDIVLEPPRR